MPLREILKFQRCAGIRFVAGVLPPVVAFACLLTVETASAQSENQVPETPGQRVRPDIVYPETAMYSMGIPDEISSNEINLYIRIMRLSEEQEMLFRQSYKKYLDETAVYRARELSQLYHESSVVNASEPYLHPEAARQFRELFHTRQRIVDELAQQETQLITSLSPLLDEVQLSFLERVKTVRTRTRNLLSYPKYPGSDMDLFLLLDEVFLEQDQDLVALLNRNSELNAELVLYDSMITPLFINLNKQKYLASIKDVTLNANHRSGWRNTEAFKKASRQVRIERGKEFNLVRRAILAPAVHTAKHIHKLSRQSIDSIALHLNPSQGKALFRKFADRAYPQIFPDHDDLDDLFLSVLENPSLAEETMQDCTALHLSFREEHELFNRKLIQRYLDNEESLRSTGSSNNNRLREFRDEMISGMARRRSHALEYLALLKLTLGENLDDETTQLFTTRDQSLREPIPPYRTGFANIDNNWTVDTFPLRK